MTNALSNMILSHSGWRGIFATDGCEESRTGEVSPAHKLVAAGAALTFVEYLRETAADVPLVLTGTDTRPTGPAIAEAVIRVLIASGCRVLHAGVTAAPEIMARARNLGNGGFGFIYITASHNPIGHNGFKFGLTDGGVLSAEVTAKLTSKFRSLMEKPDTPARLERLMISADPVLLRETYAAEREVKKETLAAYSAFSSQVAWAGDSIARVFSCGIAERPLGICCDFNGSSRCVSIDRDFFDGLGIQCKAINDKPGEIAHRIVPEGEALEPCRLFLEEIHRRKPAFVTGYVPDCDGDRGNLVIWDEHLQKARALEAQEVFALACVAELAQLVYTGTISYNGSGKTLSKTAIAVNDPTSLRIDRIAEAFGVSVFRAEVGEANVVGLARRLRENGYTVRILGEGSAGGNITHPSAVRDPLHTVLALAKLLCIRTTAGKPGLFELWCRSSGQTQMYQPNFGLAEIIASLPPFVTTATGAPEAVLKITTSDHGMLKSRYQQIFLREWKKRKDQLKTRYGIYGREVAAYNGMEERKDIADFGEAGRGGLKICFTNAGGLAVASIWMRGSATENIFRIMADAEEGRQFERYLIEWQRQMVIEAESIGVRVIASQ